MVSRVVEVVVGGVVVDGLAVVGVVIDERRRDGGLVAVDGSVVGGVNGSVWPYRRVCLEHTCLASVSITKEAAETTLYTRASWHHHKNKQGDSTPDNNLDC